MINTRSIDYQTKEGKSIALFGDGFNEDIHGLVLLGRAPVPFVPNPTLVGFFEAFILLGITIGDPFVRVEVSGLENVSTSLLRLCSDRLSMMLENETANYETSTFKRCVPTVASSFLLTVQHGAALLF